MTDIPKRIYKIWQTPLDIHTCGGLLEELKLQCSNCDAKFDTESGFAIHIEKCLRNAKHDLNYQVHMHANRLLMVQSRVALFCGASNQQQYLECGLCKATFEEESKVKEHIRRCTEYKKEFGKFMDKARPLFSNMLHSYEQLCHLFQKYVMDEHIVRIRETGSPKLAEGELPQLEPVANNVFFDDISEHFIEKYQEYIFEVTSFTDDVFIRYLKKMELDDGKDEIRYTLPSRRRVRYDEESDVEELETESEKEEEEEEEEDGFDSDDEEEDLEIDIDEEDEDEDVEMTDDDGEIQGDQEEEYYDGISDDEYFEENQDNEHENQLNIVV